VHCSVVLLNGRHLGVLMLYPQDDSKSSLGFQPQCHAPCIGWKILCLYGTNELMRGKVSQFHNVPALILEGTQSEAVGLREFNTW